MTRPLDTQVSASLRTDGAVAMDAGAAQRADRPMLECLVAIARQNGLTLTVDQLSREHRLPARDLTPKELGPLARQVGMRARVATTTWERLTRKDSTLPVIARFADGRAVVVVGVHHGETETKVAVTDPVANPLMATLMSQEEFTALWRGEIVLVWRVYALTATDQPFGLRWFASELWPERAAFRDVAVAAILLQVLGLASPLFFQIVFDKVLSHNTFQTLYVLVAGVVVAILFEAVFGAIRRYLLLAATNKIDMRLASRTFGHLLSLPIAFFEQVPAGITVQHMQQVERVREFLTGRLLLTALDSAALVVFLPILMLYSVPLTLIVLLSSTLMTGIIIAMIKPFNRRLSQFCRAEADRQSMLVESIHGMRTVKSSAIEPVQRRNWDRSVANAVHMQFRVVQMSLIAQSVNQVVEKLTPVAVIGCGALLVMDHTMTVGALIAFQMLSGRVVQPLVQIVGLVQNYQETLLSVRMLAEVMNQPPERPVGSTGLTPPITGDLEFEKVRFRYRRDGPQILESVSLHIPAGAVVGIVGRSGSGKTTLTRLVQGMNLPQEGLIRFDGIDMREIDLPHLRRNIGVVLQDNFLFRGTVRENIAITRPGASLEEVVATARMAGADEFIERMPQGYDTRIEENAANLSGGQRQRLAIARALLTRPKLLILDEATSALDPDSEAIFMDNLNTIVSGRTVLIVSHRLTTLVRCTAIIVMDRGRIVDGGTHAELLQRCAIYQHLWNQQHRQH